MEILEGLMIEIETSFELGERFVLVPVWEKSTRSFTYLLKYERIVGEISDERTQGQVHLSQVQAEAIAAFCLNINIPIIPKDPMMGLDGTTTKVTIIQGMNKAQLQWWQNAPTPWKPVERLIEMIKKIVKDAKSGIKNAH